MNKYIETGLIQPSELDNLLRSDVPVRLIDASYVLGGPVPVEPYNQKRIGDAVFFDIDGVSDKKTILPHMLPSSAEFKEAVEALGISNDDFIVIYGQTGVHFGPARAWWTFRVFGHDNVCVLDGGLPVWEREGYPVNTQQPVKHPPASFNPSFQSSLVKTL
jgi:thiosulfate/3-mercaptopyruvate sulfurtransferase